MLWPEEFEGWRDEARSMAGMIAELYGVDAMGGGAVGSDPATRLAAQRAALAALDQESPAGRDETIAGVPCRVFDAGVTGGERGTYEAELAVYPDCIHGFTGFPMELAKRANRRIDAFLRRCFAV